MVSDIAEWLGYEVIDVEGEYVLRYRQQTGRWAEREQRATDAEVRLYDAVRGLVASTTKAAHLMPLARVALVLGLPARGFSFLEVLEKLAGLMADNRQLREQMAVMRREKMEGLKGVEDLKAERWKAHPLSTPPYYRNEGEQNAFTMVLDLLKTGRWPL